MKEKIEIWKQFKKDSKNSINKCGEIYGACRHLTKFHWYIMNSTSTDNGQDPEKSQVQKTESIENHIIVLYEDLNQNFFLKLFFEIIFTFELLIFLNFTL
jgi:CRISPR/Cas system-associated protein Csx1